MGIAFLGFADWTHRVSHCALRPPPEQLLPLSEDLNSQTIGKKMEKNKITKKNVNTYERTMEIRFKKTEFDQPWSKDTTHVHIKNNDIELLNYVSLAFIFPLGT